MGCSTPGALRHLVSQRFRYGSRTSVVAWSSSVTDAMASSIWCMTWRWKSDAFSQSSVVVCWRIARFLTFAHWSELCPSFFISIMIVVVAALVRAPPFMPDWYLLTAFAVAGEWSPLAVALHATHPRRDYRFLAVGAVAVIELGRFLHANAPP